MLGDPLERIGLDLDLLAVGDPQTDAELGEGAVCLFDLVRVACGEEYLPFTYQDWRPRSSLC